jgi:ABC-type amino acid transport substrate-binding protein
VERLRATESALALRFDIELLAWNRAMSMAQQGRGGILGVSYTKARAVWLDFSQPLFADDIHVVVRRDSGFQPQQLSDLQGRLIGIGNGVSYGEELEQALAAGQFRVTRDWGIQRRLRILLSGRVDGVFIGGGRAGFDTALRSEAGLWERREELLWLPQPVLRDRLYLGFAKRMGQGALLERFNAALSALPKLA